MKTIIVTLVFVAFVVSGYVVLAYPDQVRAVSLSLFDHEHGRVIDLERLERDGERLVGWRRLAVFPREAACIAEARRLHERDPAQRVRCMVYDARGRYLHMASPP